MEDTGAGWPEYCFRQLPRTSVDIRGMCVRKMEDEIRYIMRNSAENFPKSPKLGQGGQNIASVSFRQLPRASADIRGMFGRQMKDGIWKL